MGGLAFLHRIHLTVNATNGVDKISVLNDMSFLVESWIITESCWLHFTLWATKDGRLGLETTCGFVKELCNTDPILIVELLNGEEHL